jgi:hypothetical protein
LQGAPNLQHLSINGAFGRDPKHNSMQLLSGYISDNKQLQFLNIQFYLEDDAILQLATALTGHPSLNALTIERFSCTEKSVAALTQALKTCEKLTVIKFPYTSSKLLEDMILKLPAVMQAETWYKHLCLCNKEGKDKRKFISYCACPREL